MTHQLWVLRAQTMNKLRAAAYCRVSTDRAEQSGSLASQRSFFDDYIRNSDSMTLVGVFYDEGTSGTTTLNRYGFNKMISLAVSGGIDIILTKEVSRFARNTVDTLNITRMLRAKGVGIIFINDNIDTRDSDGELRLSIMATIAQEESRKISERVKWGQQRKMEQGVVFGRSCLGYDVKDGKITVNADSAEIVKRIYREYLEGLSMDKIAAGLERDGILTGAGGKRWHTSTINKILRNEKYIGDALLQKTYTTDFLNKTRVKNNGIVPQYYVENDHEAIIPRDIFMRVQEELVRRSSVKPGPNGKKHTYSCNYCFSQMIVCGECGEQFRRIHWNNRGCKSIVWRCISRLEPTGQECHARIVNEMVLENVVVQAINTLLGDKSTYQAQLQQNIAKVIRSAQQNTADGINERLQRLQKELLKKANSKEAYDEIADEIFKLREQHEKCTVAFVLWT